MSSPAPSTLRLWLRPQLVFLHLLLVASLGFCAWMGFWQLGVYDDRQVDERADRQEVPVVPLDRVIEPGDEFSPAANQRPVTVRGEYADADLQFWVADRAHDERSGYALATPLIVDGGDVALIVLRGWAPEPGALPAVPEGVQEFEVVLEPGGRNTGPMSDDRVLGTARLPLLRSELGLRLYAAVGLNTDAAQAGELALLDPPEPESTWTVGLRNLAYSFQWWVFGAFAAFMWWRMCTDSVRSARAVPEESSDDPVSRDVEEESSV